MANKVTQGCKQNYFTSPNLLTHICLREGQYGFIIVKLFNQYLLTRRNWLSDSCLAQL